MLAFPSLARVAIAMDFAQKYCVRFGVKDREFGPTVLRQVLYPHARVLYPLINRFAYDFFAADRDFIAGVGCISRREGFADEANEFINHRANYGFLRGLFRLRASVGRTRALVEDVFRE